MNIKTKRAFAIISLMMLACFTLTANAASQCGGTPWKKSGGKRCTDLGLDSNKAVCREGDKFAMWCDSTVNQIRICASENKCASATASSDTSSCPRKIRKQNKPKRKCTAYEDGYVYGKKDAEENRSEDHERWDDKYRKGMGGYFAQGYKYGYRDN